MGITPSYNCTECKKEFPFENIRYANDGKKIVCAECYALYMKRESKKPKKAEKAALGDIKMPGSIKLICIDCRYKFSLKDLTRVNIRCPYCGKKNLMRDEITVEKLLREVSHPNYGSLV